MTRMVMCAKLKEELPGLDHAPMKGEFGERLYNEISAEAWQLWLKHSTMVINEYRLNPSEEKAQTILLEQMNKFFFEDGDVERPPEYIDPSLAPQEPSEE